MLGPYRDLVPLDPDPLPDACVPRGTLPKRCPYAAPLAPARGLPRAFARALSASATALLLVASASVGAITWTAVSTLVAARHGHAREAPPVLPQTRATPPDTHDPDALWARAEWARERYGAPTLVRATIAPGALGLATLPVRVAFEKGSSDRPVLRVLDAPEGSSARLLGLRPDDRITAVNGFRLDRPDDALSAYAHLTAGKSAIVELWREGRTVALRIDAASVDGT
jgi:hypothetical protein